MEWLARLGQVPRLRRPGQLPQEGTRVTPAEPVAPIPTALTFLGVPVSTLTTTAGVGGLLPADYGTLIVQPVTDAAVATRVANVATTGSTEFRIPVVVEDAGATWVAEGDEIPADDATFAEVVVVPAKLAGLTIISRELAEDSTPAAAEVVGQSLARDMARRLDAAFFGNLAAPAPAGLGSLPTSGAGAVSTVDAGAAWADVDPFAEAISKAEQVGATLRAFVAHPDDALALSTLKQATGSNVPLLGADPTVATRRTILGAPMFTSPAVPAGTVYGIPADRVMVVMRDDVRLEVSREAYFSSDRVAVKATMRVGFAFPHAAAVLRVALTA
jgi:HK97 family phage major capsid protein